MVFVLFCGQAQDEFDDGRIQVSHEFLWKTMFPQFPQKEQSLLDLIQDDIYVRPPTISITGDGGTQKLTLDIEGWVVAWEVVQEGI